VTIHLGEPVNVVACDFDGVLNSHASHMAKPPEERKRMTLDPVAVARLNRLVRETGAVVVVSSSWRENRDRAMLQAVLDEVGFEGTVIGRTPRFLKTTPGGLAVAESRGHEIQTWLDAASDYGILIKGFVILDDSSDMTPLMDRLVKTEFATGLLDEHVDRAIAMLREPPPLLVTPTAEDVERLVRFTP
jgi:hypothetical protein